MRTSKKLVLNGIYDNEYVMARQYWEKNVLKIDISKYALEMDKSLMAMYIKAKWLRPWGTYPNVPSGPTPIE